MVGAVQAVNEVFLTVQAFEAGYSWGVLEMGG